MPSEPGPRAPSPAAPSLDSLALLAAPDSIVQGGAVFRSTTDVYRNFALGANDHRAIASVIMKSAGIDSIPAGLIPKYVWVIHGTETWGAELTYRFSIPEYDGRPAYAQASAWGGPEWTVGDSIRVVTGIPDSTGVIRLLRCPDDVVTAAS